MHYFGPCKGSLIYQVNQKTFARQTEKPKYQISYKFLCCSNPEECFQDNYLDSEGDYVELINRNIYEETYFAPYFEEDAFHESLFIDVCSDSSDTEDEEIDFDMIDHQ